MHENEPQLSLDEAYRAAFHFINQCNARERVTPFMPMLHSMGLAGQRETNDPATWQDWFASLDNAVGSPDLPALHPPLD